MLEHKRKEGQDKAVLSPLEIASILEGHLDTGYSVDRYGDSPHEGYAVGLVHTEVRCNFRPNRRLVLDWVEKQSDERKYDPHPWVFGVWFDKGYYYLDVSLIIDDREKAIRAAEYGKQLAIYDYAKGEEIRLDGSEKHEPCDVRLAVCVTEGCQEKVTGHCRVDPEPREHVSADPRVSQPEPATRCGFHPDVTDCKGCRYEHAERPGKCSVCPVERK